MAFKITGRQRQELTEAFNIFDVSKSGKISRKELKKILRGLGQSPTEVEVAEMIKEMDQNHSNTISLNEFVALFETKITMNKFDNDLEKAWGVFDKTEKGKIGITELREVMLSLGEDLTDANLHLMIKTIDADEDGFVTLEDFKRVMAD